MESPAARSLSIFAVRCFRRQLSPVLNSGVLLHQHSLDALGGASGVEWFVDSNARDSLMRSDQLTNDGVLARDSAISHLDALMAPVRNGEVGHSPSEWSRLHVANSMLRSETRAIFSKDDSLEKFSELMLNSAQRELKEQFASVRRSSRDLSRFVYDLAESSREASSLATVVADSSVEACSNTCATQAERPRNGVSHLASSLDCVDEDFGLSVLQQGNIPLGCSSVKRKRKKKMNKHKQRKLRRRDRHRKG